MRISDWSSDVCSSVLLSGDFLQVNRYLVDELKKLGLWTPETRDAIKQAEGSVQGLSQLPATLREIYRTAWEVPLRSLIDMAADRGAFIDHSASLNLFMESPNIGATSSSSGEHTSELQSL